jgi:hypothetical protein
MTGSAKQSIARDEIMDSFVVGQAGSEKFFESGLDSDLLICPTGSLRAKADRCPQ